MTCSLCFTSWKHVECLEQHLIAHGRLDLVAQMRHGFKLHQDSKERWEKHQWGSCTCRFKGVYLECELRNKPLTPARSSGIK